MNFARQNPLKIFTIQSTKIDGLDWISKEFCFWIILHLPIWTHDNSMNLFSMFGSLPGFEPRTLVICDKNVTNYTTEIRFNILNKYICTVSEVVFKLYGYFSINIKIRIIRIIIIRPYVSASDRSNFWVQGFYKFTIDPVTYDIGCWLFADKH